MLGLYRYIVVSCFDTQQENVDSSLISFWEEQNRQFQRKTGVLNLSRVYVGIPPAGGAHQKKVLVFTPRIVKDRCVMIANMQDGWASLGFVITSRLDVHCFQFRLSAADLEYPANSFTLIYGGKIVRHVSAMKDTRWEFYEQGDPIPEEDTSQYDRRRVRDRLTLDHTCDLARKCGYDIRNDDFWTTNREALYYSEIV